MENTIEAQLEALHGAWCHATGQELHFRSTERLFFDLHQMEFTPDDIRTVVAHLKSLNAKSDVKYSLRANRVLGDLEFFSSSLAEAKATNRNRRQPMTPKQQAQDMREKVVNREQSSILNISAPRSFADVIKEMKVGEG